MFLFLLLAFMVVWAMSLVVGTQLAFGANDDKSQAENWGPFAIGSRSIWIEFQSRVLELARVSARRSVPPNSEQQTRCLGDGSWRLSLREWNAGSFRLIGLTSWSRELKGAVAWATGTQFGERHTAEWQAPRRSQQWVRLVDVGRAWLGNIDCGIIVSIALR